MVLNIEWTLVPSLLLFCGSVSFARASIFRHEVLLSASGLCQSGSGSGCVGCRCSVPHLGRPVSLRNSALPHPVSGSPEGRLQQPAMTLIAPKRPAQPWFPVRLALSHVLPFPLRIGPRDLLQPRSGFPHASPQVFHLHAWHLAVVNAIIRGLC